MMIFGRVGNLKKIKLINHTSTYQTNVPYLRNHLKFVVRFFDPWLWTLNVNKMLVYLMSNRNDWSWLYTSQARGQQTYWPGITDCPIYFHLSFVHQVDIVLSNLCCRKMIVIYRLSVYRFVRMFYSDISFWYF